MKYEEIMDIIIKSSEEDWKIFEGASFLNKFVNVTSQNMHYMESDSHSHIASYKDNVSIGMAWGIVVNEDFKESWANKHDNPSAESRYWDIFYNGMLIERKLYVVIDGGRSFMPLPEREIDKKTYKATKHYISRKEYKFFQLFNNLQGYDTQYGRYLKESGIDIEN